MPFPWVWPHPRSSAKTGTLQEGLWRWRGSGTATSLLFGISQSFANTGSCHTELFLCVWGQPKHAASASWIANGRILCSREILGLAPVIKTRNWHHKWAKEELPRFSGVYMCAWLLRWAVWMASQGCTKQILTYCSSLLSKYAITFGRKFDSENPKL